MPHAVNVHAPGDGRPRVEQRSRGTFHCRSARPEPGEPRLGVVAEVEHLGFGHCVVALARSRVRNSHVELARQRPPSLRVALRPADQNVLVPRVVGQGIIAVARHANKL
eukprot:scaffold124721_cov66-Phaeocystis_antarctica.AAC.6